MQHEVLLALSGCPGNTFAVSRQSGLFEVIYSFVAFLEGTVDKSCASTLKQKPFLIAVTRLLVVE